MELLHSLFLVITIFSQQVNSQSSCDDAGKFRLYSTPGGEPNEGMVQRCVAPNWRGVCGYLWSCDDASVICRQLGYPSNDALATTVSTITIPWSGGRDTYRYNCSGMEESLDDCPINLFSCPTNTIARALCRGEELCSHGELRLVGGESPNRGRLEICYEGKWNQYCGTLGYNEAATACKQLGYTEFPRIITDERYGRSNSSYRHFGSISCSNHGNESRLIDCTLSGTSNCSYIAPNCQSFERQAGLECFNAPTAAPNAAVPSCENGTARLVNGSIDQEGRIEVCIGGVWGSMCSSVWNNPSANAYVVCSQLGHRSSSTGSLLSSLMFGTGEGPVFRGFRCEGWEQNIGQCYNRTLQYSPTSSGNCDWNDIVAVRCRDFCNSGDVRLVGGPDNNSGVVEICSNSLWGLIAEPGWSDANAAVVCRRLQLSDEGAVAVNITRAGFSKPKKAIHRSNVHCTGREYSITQCSGYSHSLDVGIRLMDQLEVAGVSCQPNIPTIDKVYQTNTSNAVFSALTFTVILAMLLIVVGLMVYYFKYKPTKQNEVKTVAIAMENKPAKAGYNTYGNQNDDDEQDDVYENPGEVNM